MNITDTYYQHTVQHPNRPAIIMKDKSINYLEWYKLVQSAAAAFAEELYETKRVVLFLPNGHLFLQLFAGASAAGWASVIGDTNWTEYEIALRLNAIKPDIIIADAQMKNRLKHGYKKIIFSNEVYNWLSNHHKGNQTHKKNSPFYIGFTSGSTGEPKAFERCHKSWIESFRCNQIDLGMKRSEHVLIPGSFTGSTFLYGVLSTLYLGGTVYILKKYLSNQLMSVIENYPITFVYVIPTMLNALIREGWETKKQITFISTGSKLLTSTRKCIKQEFPNVKIHEFYGASELSFVTVLRDEQWKNHSDSVGKPVHNADVKICDNSGGEALAGEEGILYVRSNMLFNRYLNQGKDLKRIQNNEWKTVYDIARIDEEGFIYILGRDSDVILYGGINIFPQEIENVLKKLDDMEEVVVLGINDNYWGKVITACFKGGITRQALRLHCRRYLANYKTPRIWLKVESFPYTTNGKISRNRLKNWVESRNI